jgi:hypothetical protein
MSLEGWKALFEIGGVILLFLTFVFGAGALITSNRINSRQEVHLREFNKQLTDAQQEIGIAKERAAELELQTAGVRLELEREIQKHAPRTLTDEQKAILISELRGKVPKVIFVVQRDLESRWFALQLEIVFQDAGAKLSVSEMALGEIMPIPAGVLMYKPGGTTSEDELKNDPLYNALKRAHLFGGTAARPFASLERGPQGPMLPSDVYIVYVSQKLP